MKGSMPPEEAAQFALTAPWRELASEGESMVVPTDYARYWNISDEARESLTSVGLPLMDPGNLNSFHANPQDSTEPIVSYHGRRFYSLGFMAYHEIGILAGKDIVLGIPSDELQHAFLVNTGVEKFIELCWRYSWLEPALSSVEDDDVLFDGLERAWKAFVAIDPSIDLDRSISLWQEILEGWQ
jgi:hypothetical protein